MRVSGLIAAAGMLVAGLSPAPSLAIAGLCALRHRHRQHGADRLFGGGQPARHVVGRGNGVVTTMGYCGILLAPSAIGFIGEQIGLGPVFVALSALLVLVFLMAGLPAADFTHLSSRGFPKRQRIKCPCTGHIGNRPRGGLKRYRNRVYCPPESRPVQDFQTRPIRPG